MRADCASIHLAGERWRSRQLKTRVTLSSSCSRFSFFRRHGIEALLARKDTAMNFGASDNELVNELSELHDGSVSLFVTLPVFRNMLTCPILVESFEQLERMVGEHFAQLDRILASVPVGERQCDGDVTKSLFDSLRSMHGQAASPLRDAEIVQAVQQAQLYLLGSCGFALRCARQDGLDGVAALLEISMRRMRSVGLPVLLGNSTADRTEALAVLVA
jgi:hypothetical protein